MRSLFRDGLAREECDECGATWIDGEFVAKVLGRASSEALPRRAKGQPGGCKGCGAKLQYVPGCPECGLRAPTCPRCGTAPLAVIEVLHLKVDVCGGCSGVALDAGELEHLHQAATPLRDELLPSRPRETAAPAAPSHCASCERKLKAEHAFAWEGHFYCGSCAPEGAAPVTAELTKALPSAVGRLDAARLGDTDTESALVWLFSKLFG
jgi:Zn-finger nucleic acid-binding protein